jgi:hypothetical protein
MIESIAPGSTYFKTFRHQRLPPEHALARRLEQFTMALLGQLRARKLVPHRERVAVRRVAGDRAWRARGGIPARARWLERRRELILAAGRLPRERARSARPPHTEGQQPDCDAHADEQRNRTKYHPG